MTRSALFFLTCCLLLGPGPVHAARPGDRAPEIAAGSVWIGSEPTSLAVLRGRVVLVNFWTFGCYNCQNTLPALARWHERFAGRGLVILGVHSPEFARERGREAVAEAVERHGIEYPVVVDDEMRTWNAYENLYWPAFYFVDRRGSIRFMRFGEGRYEESERWIEQLLAESP